MCQAGGFVGGGEDTAAGGGGGRDKEGSSTKGCGYFEWAEFDDDGVPMWLSELRRRKQKEEKDENAKED